MDRVELDALLVRHIGDLDSSVQRVGELEQSVGEAIDIVFVEWGRENDWIVKDGWEKNYCSVMPRAWRREVDEWPAFFELGYGSGEPVERAAGGDYFWLTRLCGAGQGQVGFRFGQDEFGKREWRKFIREYSDIVQGTNFILDDDPSFFLPLRVDIERLSVAIVNDDIVSALQPIKDALDHIAEHVAKFDALLSAMRARGTQQ